MPQWLLCGLNGVKAVLDKTSWNEGWIESGQVRKSLYMKWGWEGPQIGHMRSVSVGDYVNPSLGLQLRIMQSIGTIDSTHSEMLFKRQYSVTAMDAIIGRKAAWWCSSRPCPTRACSAAVAAADLERPAAVIPAWESNDISNHNSILNHIGTCNHNSRCN